MFPAHEVWAGYVVGSEIAEPQLEAGCVKSYFEEARQEMTKVACDNLDLANHILASRTANPDEKLVPKYLFHYGRKADLVTDAQVGERGGITKEVWDKFIMPGVAAPGNRYGLPPERQGLYGTSGIDTNSYGFDDYSWLMEIAVKDECRTSGSTITFASLPENPVLAEWFLRGRSKADLKDFSETCMQFAFDYRQPFRTEECQKIVNAFLNEKKFKVIQDLGTQKSFYLRDRECIESIRSTPKQILEMHGDRPELWIFSCTLNGSHPARGDILLKALSDVGEALDPFLLKKLDLHLALMEASATYKRWPSVLREALGAHERCLASEKLGLEGFQRAMRPFLERIAKAENPALMPWEEKDVTMLRELCR